jgi:hypothetical protein
MPDAVTGESPLDEDIVRASFLVRPDRRPPCRRSRAVLACRWGRDDACPHARSAHSTAEYRPSESFPHAADIVLRDTPVALRSGASPAPSRSSPSFQSLRNGLSRATPICPPASVVDRLQLGSSHSRFHGIGDGDCNDALGHASLSSSPRQMSQQTRPHVMSSDGGEP